MNRDKNLNKKTENLTDSAWQQLFDKYDILEKIKNDGIYHITANEIKEFREPRLMAKWDSSEQLPKIFKKNKINILPNSRKSYILGEFQLYEPLPSLEEHVQTMPKVVLPQLETVDIDNISSEANAINVLQISGILEDFLGLEVGEDLYATFNGRMKSGEFSFHVDTFQGDTQTIHVNNAQVEIDGGFESEHYVTILEAKNVIHEDFHIRQLYYPFRLWENKVKKPVKLIFSVYSNKIFRLMEYVFVQTDNYSSIKLIKTRNYSLENTDISIDELKRAFDSVTNIIDDNQNISDVPFIQADNFDRIVSLLENMYMNNMTADEIENLMQFTSRQRDYYFNAGRYLGLFEKYKEDELRYYRLTDLGKKIYKLNYKDRQLKLVELILSHKIFRDSFEFVLQHGEFPDIEFIKELAQNYNVCSPNLVYRRSQSVLSWIKWIFNLQKL
ncbi:type II restriction enzyme [Listeria kieliensis]|uniref:GATC--recognizing Type II restriction modification system (MmyCV) endonuclease subunit n=1 Tax=Listeria kieliensis TaxID=1621700 RepID=A0A3D8TQR7_9LIST|nr:type II restriction endonuclease [Listeria kieliensis]RDX01043.1 GATC--recognizing Type II restriction modification system (MmyCV) endonuclease subunit [Listeria kieliensis]